MKSVVSEKGQVTIPKAIRDRLGLTPGTKIEFEAESGRLVGKKALGADPLRKWRGAGRLPVRVSVNSYLETVRGRANRT
jgi:AbrB family looped-hinge helix DNA binding protein